MATEIQGNSEEVYTNLINQLDELEKKQNINDNKINVFICVNSINNQNECYILNDEYNYIIQNHAKSNSNDNKEITFNSQTIKYKEIYPIKYKKEDENNYYVIIVNNLNDDIEAILVKENNKPKDGSELLSNYIILTLIMYLKEYISKKLIIKHNKYHI